MLKYQCRLVPAYHWISSSKGVHTHASGAGGRLNAVPELVGNRGGRSSNYVFDHILSRGSSGSRAQTGTDWVSSRDLGYVYGTPKGYHTHNPDFGRSSTLPDGVSIRSGSNVTYDAWVQSRPSRTGSFAEFIHSQTPQTNMSTQVAVSSSNRLCDNSSMVGDIGSGYRGGSFISDAGAQMLLSKMSAIEARLDCAEFAQAVAATRIRTGDSMELARMGFDVVGQIGGQPPAPLEPPAQLVSTLRNTIVEQAVNSVERVDSAWVRMEVGASAEDVVLIRGWAKLAAEYARELSATTAAQVSTPAVDISTPAVDISTPAVDISTPAAQISTEAAQVVTNYVEAAAFATEVASKVETSAPLRSAQRASVNAASEALSLQISKLEGEIEGLLACIKSRLCHMAPTNRLGTSAPGKSMAEQRHAFYDFADNMSEVTREYMGRVQSMKTELSQKTIELSTKTAELVAKTQDVRVMRGQADQYRLAIQKLIEAVNLDGIDAATVAQIASNLAQILQHAT